MNKKDLFAMAAACLEGQDYDSTFGSGYVDTTNDKECELADKVHKEIMAWLRKKAGQIKKVKSFKIKQPIKSELNFATMTLDEIADLAKKKKSI